MSSERGFRLLIVGRPADFGRAMAEASPLLDDRAASRPSNSGQPLIGVWVDSVLAQHPPTTLGRAGNARFEIYESVSVDGIWRLLTVSPLSTNLTSEPCTLRERLIASLMRERSAYAQPAAAAMFAPVFNEPTSSNEIDACVRRLHRVFPGRILDEIVLRGKLDLGAAKSGRRHFDRVD